MAIELGGVIFLSLGGFLGEKGWQYPFLIYGIALICLVLTILFIPSQKSNVIEVQSEDVLEKKITVTGIILNIVLTTSIAMILFFITFVTLPSYLPSKFVFSESETGYFMAFISLIAVVSASLMPSITHKFGSWKTVSLGFSIFAIGYLFFAFSSNIVVSVELR
jgi:predicted MFS family arabinose efflux permease